MVKRKIYTLSILISIFIVEALTYYFLFQKRCFFAFNLSTHVHAIGALRFYQLSYIKAPIQELAIQFFSIGHWPRLHYVFTTLFISLFGRNYMSMAMVNTLYLLILMLSVYGITIEITKNRWCALLSSFIVSAYPVIVQFMGVFELPVGVIAFTSLSVYFLIKSDYFKKTTYSILFAIFVCLSMYMDRLTPIVFITGPVVYILYGAVQKMWVDNGYKKTFLNTSLILLIIVALLTPFYLTWIKDYILTKSHFLVLTNVSNTPYSSGAQAWKEVINFNSPLLFKRIFFYITVFPNWLIGIFWSIIFLCSLPLFLKNKYQHSRILLWWLIFPIIFFTFIPKKDFAYIIPVLAAVAIITAIGVFSLKNKFLRIFSLVIICLFGIWQDIFFLSYLNSTPNSALNKFFTNIDVGKKDLLINDYFEPYFTDKNIYQWFSNDIVKFFPVNKEFTITLFERPDLLEYSFGAVILLSNPRVTVLPFNRESNAFIHSGNDYVIFIKDKDSQKSLISEIQDQVSFSNPGNTGRSKINLQDYTLVYKKIHPSLPIAIEIYKISLLK